MASSLHPNPATFLKPVLTRPITSTSAATRLSVQCGPRDKRGPLVKGRVLSIEAIQAVQSLKRLHKDPTRTRPSSPASSNWTWSPPSRSFSARTNATWPYKPSPPSDPNTHPTCHSTLTWHWRSRETGCPRKSILWSVSSTRRAVGSSGGVIRLIRAVIGADRRESTVRMYEMLKRNGWGSSRGFSADEYMVRTMSKGLRRLGEVGLADEVNVKFGSQMSLHS